MPVQERQRAQHRVLLRITSRSGSYPLFIPIAVIPLPTIFQALDSESCFISHFKPQFNANTLAVISGKINNYVHKARLKTLWRRAHRLLHNTSIQDSRIKRLSRSAQNHAMVSALCIPSYRSFLAQNIMSEQSTSAVNI